MIRMKLCLVCVNHGFSDMVHGRRNHKSGNLGVDYCPCQLLTHAPHHTALYNTHYLYLFVPYRMGHPTYNMVSMFLTGTKHIYRYHYLYCSYKPTWLTMGPHPVLIHSRNVQRAFAFSSHDASNFTLRCQAAFVESEACNATRVAVNEERFEAIKVFGQSIS